MDTESQEPVVIPYRELSPEALRGVVESFVLREGTEYGEREVPLEQKVAQVLRQLERGEAQVIYHAPLETVDIVMTRTLSTERRKENKQPDREAFEPREYSSPACYAHEFDQRKSEEGSD